MIYGIKKSRMGEKRTVVRFAYLPKRLTDGQTIWLGRYRETQELCGISTMGEPPQPPLAWVAIDRKALAGEETK